MSRRYGRLLVIAGIGLGLTFGVAHALSEWWTPDGARCPAFDSADTCQAYCAADQSRCGGATGCTFRTGSTRPDCAMRAPDKKFIDGQSGDGWQGPGAH